MLSYGEFAYTYTEDGATRTKTDTGTGETTTYGYDALGNLVRVDLPDGRVVEYLMDGGQRRVGKKIDGVVVKEWLYADEVAIAAEMNGDGTLAARFLRATGSNIPEVFDSPSGQKRIISDPLSGILLVVDSLTGAVERKVTMDEWGRVLAQQGVNGEGVGFTGGLRDAETGLVRFGVRDYDPLTGRWLIGEHHAQGLNLYAYAENDPINAADVDGRQSVPKGGKATLPFGADFKPAAPPSVTPANPPEPPKFPRPPSDPPSPRRPGDRPPGKFPKIPKPPGLPDVLPWPFPLPPQPDFTPFSPWPWTPPAPYEPPYCPA